LIHHNVATSGAPHHCGMNEATPRLDRLREYLELKARADWYRSWASLVDNPTERAWRLRIAEMFEARARELRDDASLGGGGR